MKMPIENESLTPEAAARTLRDLEGYEEQLTAKAIGITMMVFGLGAPAINMAYHLAHESAFFLEQPWWFSFLWIPWIFGAIITTSAVWRAHAVTFGDPYKSKDDWKYGLGFSILYMALLGGIGLWSRYIGPWLHPGTMNLIVLGLFTFAILLMWRRENGHSVHVVPMVVAGLALIALGLVAATVRLDGTIATFTATFGSMGAWMGAGWVIQRRG